MPYGIAHRRERYDLDKSKVDYEKNYPHVFTAMREIYPDYDIILDVWRERPLCIRRAGPESIFPVCYLENTDGTPAEPSMEFVEKLRLSDWLTKYDSVEDFLDAMEKNEAEVEEKLKARVSNEWDLVAKSLHGWVERDPKSVQIVLKPFYRDHRQQISDTMNSRPAAADESTEATP